MIKPSSMGDIVHSFPAVALLQKYCPDAKIDFVIKPEFADLLDYAPFAVERKIIFERRKLGSPGKILPELLKLRKVLRRKKYDLTVDLQGLFRSALCAGLAKSRHTAGFAAPREKAAVFYYDLKVPVKSLHAIEKQMELISTLFGGTEKLAEPPPPVVNDELPAGMPHQNLITVFPASLWKSKEFPVKIFADIISGLHRHFPAYSFAVCGSKKEVRIMQELYDALPNGFPLIDLTGKTSLRQLFAVIDHSDAVLCNDSGPLHIAAYLRKNCFAFFGPTDPRRTGPWYENSKVYRNTSGCTACLKRKCRTGTQCCLDISTDQVISDICTVLKKNNPAK